MRYQRWKTDKFALISEVWNKFIENRQNSYKPLAKITVNEQLFPTKARCRFTQDMSSTQYKYSIKTWLASDIINTVLYLENDNRHRPPISRISCTETNRIIYGLWKNCNYRQRFTRISLAKKTPSISWNYPLK